MSFKFGASTTDKVSVAAASSINDLQAFSVLLWYHLLGTTPSVEMNLFGKRATDTTAGKRIFITASNEISCLAGRATSNSTWVSSAGVSDKYVWNFIAVTYDLTNGFIVRHGTDRKIPKLITPASSALGSGALKADAANPLLIGNNYSDTNPFLGLIGPVGIFNRALPGHEVRTQYGNISKVTGAKSILFLGRNNTTQKQFDLSGSLNHGIVTGSINKAPSPKFSRIVPQEM